MSELQYLDDRTIEYYNNLRLITLNKEQRELHCDYWYLIHSDNYSHTAFRTRQELSDWLEKRNLALTQPLMPEGNWSVQPIAGSYYHDCMRSEEEFNKMDCLFATRHMSNGHWTIAKVTEDEYGIRTFHYLNPNNNRIILNVKGDLR